MKRSQFLASLLALVAAPVVARPQKRKTIAIELSSISNIKTFDDKHISAREVLEIYDSTGILIYRSPSGELTLLQNK